MISLFPLFLMKFARISTSILLAATVLFPASALALSGIGPRIDVEGSILQINLTEQQRFMQKGGELVVQTTNGQKIQVILMDNAKIITEGRLSRKGAIPSDLRTGMNIRVRGLRLSEDSVKVSMVIITNIEKNPATSANGILTSIDDNSISILDQSGVTKTYSVDAGTEVKVEYNDLGRNGLNLIGKKAAINFSRANPTLVKVIRLSLPEKN